MTTYSATTFPEYTAQLLDFIDRCRPPYDRIEVQCDEFDTLALSLFALQFEHNQPYRRFCQARKIAPENVGHWSNIPAVPAAAFKEFALTCLPPAERARVFHSSGTTGQSPSRHFHSAESLAVYEASLLRWFELRVLPGLELPARFLMLTPPPGETPHSSLAHMFETVREKFGTPDSIFTGHADRDGDWTLDQQRTISALRESVAQKRPIVLLGTAFGFVHLLDGMKETGEHFRLPPGSRAMETGGYKGRSRTLSKRDLHDLINEYLGIGITDVVSEYGMSELSSQAYDLAAGQTSARVFHFPPWARAQIVSPETRGEVAEGETGLIRIFDLANVQSVMAIQTEDLGVQFASGFELLGRAALAEPRGCSLQSI